jgi:hypothetical protein
MLDEDKNQGYQDRHNARRNKQSTALRKVQLFYEVQLLAKVVARLARTKVAPSCT